MSVRRVVALAQALTMIMLLLPGLTPSSPASVRAAIAPAEVGAVNVFDAAGNGIGCQAGTRKYKGPRLPKDPPWPPGAEPTPSPTPQPSPDASADPDASGAPLASDEATAGAPMAFLAAEVEVAQAEVAQAEPKAIPLRRSKLITGIDVSHHNGDIDYSLVKDAGHRFVFIKATQDNDFVDRMFPTNMARARDAGLAAGAYHFFDYTLDGKEQADHFLDRVEAANGINGALPPVVDVECWAPIGSSIHAVATARLRDFIERVYARTGRLPIVYTSVHMWREVVGNAEGFEGLPLWAACWGCEVPPSLAPGWDGWAFWQEGLTRIPGVGRLDGNYFAGKRKELDALKLRPFTIDAGSVATSGGTVELDLGGRDATHIRTSPDGENWSDWRRVGAVPTAQIPKEEGPHSLYAELRVGRGPRAPVVSDSIIVDRSGPEVSPPAVTLREGLIGGDAGQLPATVAWQARDVHAGLSDSVVSLSCDDSPTQRTEAPGSARPDELASWDVDVSLPPDVACTVTAISTDGAGNRTRVAVEGIVATVAASSSADLAGQQVGVIAQRGPDQGRIAVSIDGQAVGLVDLYAPLSGGPEVVYVADFPSDAAHQVSVEATGTSDPASSGTDVTVLGLVSLSAAG